MIQPGNDAKRAGQPNDKNKPSVDMIVCFTPGQTSAAQQPLVL